MDKHMIISFLGLVPPGRRWQHNPHTSVLLLGSALRLPHCTKASRLAAVGGDGRQAGSGLGRLRSCNCRNGRNARFA